MAPYNDMHFNLYIILCWATHTRRGDYNAVVIYQLQNYNWIMSLPIHRPFSVLSEPQKKVEIFCVFVK